MDDKYIEELCGLNGDFRQKLVNYYYNLPEKFKIYIMNHQRISIRKLKKHYVAHKNAEFYYTTFLKTVEKINNIENSPKKKGKLSDEDIEILDVLIKSRVLEKNKKSKAKKPFKRELVLQYHSTILKLRKENFSWENVSDYLFMNYKVKISKAYLWKFFRDNREDFQ